jgi:hypothetical protein
MRNFLILAALFGAMLVPCVAAADDPPSGWHLAGDHPENYRTGVDASGIAFLSSTPESSGAGFGTLMQSVRADAYRGQRVRFTALLRSEDVGNWAGLWMRVDEGKIVVAFDNMQDRPIKGTTVWHTYEVVLDVPPDATKIAFGTLIVSRGAVWMNHASIAAVGNDVPTTGYPIKPHPLS